MQNFWPGLLSLNLKPQAGLNWDLGDGNTLDQISVRIPDSQFILEVLKKSGPLVIASAAAAGSGANECNENWPGLVTPIYNDFKNRGKYKSEYGSVPL